MLPRKCANIRALSHVAGEDDLDAPDLDALPKPAVELPRSDLGRAVRLPWWDAFARFSKTILAPGQSAILRERLLDQLVAIGSADEAAVWAQRNLPAKNTLRAVDAKIVEERFQANLFTVGDGQAPGGTTPVATPDGLVPPVGRPDADASQKASMVARKRSRSGAIHALGKTIRLRDKDHRKFVQLQACLVCGRAPSDPHHLTFTQPRALAAHAWQSRPNK